MFDYSLFFIPTLPTYFHQTGDREAACELLPVALRQLELSEAWFEEDLLINSDKPGWCFVDWSQGLDKQASAQGIWLYCAGAAIDLCNDLGTDAPRDLREHIERRRRAMLDRLYDTDSGLFISGPDRQVSWASQVWAVLAGVLPEEEAAGCLDRVARVGDAVGMVTPYMMHHYIEALCLVGRREAAHEALRRYWGDMVKLGADTFWELFDPENPNESPYGSPVVNSYCHAWSCTPTWFLRTW